MKQGASVALARRTPGVEEVPPVSFFEFWPGWLFYAPVVAHWIALGIRYRSFSLPTAANPGITLGGLCGESKLDILRQVEGEGRGWVAPAVGFTPAGRADDSGRAEQAMAAGGLDYPVVLKPDIGCNGAGVRLIRDKIGLGDYLAAFPPGERLVLQEFVPQIGEAGIFYVRHPDDRRGAITSITLKHSPFVVGDGRSTLRDLILADRRAGRVADLYLGRLSARLGEVPAQGERVRLVFVGNHCKGSIFQNGTALTTDALLERVEQIVRCLPRFHFGRIDVRFDSLRALRRGQGFRVIEINGAGSEATHIWDPATRLRDAWSAQFFHYRQAFRIGAANRARGVRPAGLWKMWRFWRRQQRLMAAYPMND
jgi:hypothetical protein